MKKILALILLFTLFSIPAFAADYYIAQTTTATANNGWQILSTSWGGDGVTPYCGGSYSAPTFTSSAVTQDCSIKGTFSQIQLWPGRK